MPNPLLKNLWRRRLLPLLGISCALWTTVASADFREVKYNHEGLVVDLAVGLWAWPMPMDWDDDGDLDLLVACPDKPYNGVYFFENPGGDAKMPIFRKGVRVGEAPQNMQISYVDGQPHILLPGQEIVDPKADFGKRRKIYPKANIHQNGVRANMWRYVDYENDGDTDIIVGVGDWKRYGWDAAYDHDGNWRNDPLHGHVYLIENTAGPDAEAKHAEPVKLEAGGEPIDVYGWPSPSFADFDGDGDLDLLCGEFLDGFTYFENTGAREKPAYAAGKRLSHKDQEITMDLQMITPTAIDWDNDGDQDLIVGDEDGRVALVEHAGVKDGQPQFLPPVYFQQEADGINVGALATPFSIDWDHDGDEDILCGNTSGYVIFIENLTGGMEPKFAAPVRMQAGGETIRILAGPNGSIQGPAEAKWGYTNLSAADWDGDDLTDIIVNTIWGKILWYRNNGTREEPSLEAARPIEVAWPGQPQKPVWNWWNPEGNELVTQWRTTPVATDWNRDGLTDLVLLDPEGYLCLYERQEKDGQRVLLPPARHFVDPDGNPLRLNNRSVGRSGRSKIAVADWDGDGRDDLLVNSTNADWYRNVGQNPEGRTVLKKVGPLGKKNLQGHTTSPTVCDWNKDGRLELLVGSESGTIHHLTPEDAAQYAQNDITADPSQAQIEKNSDPLVLTEFVYEKAPFKQCHASTIAITPRGKVAAWFGGTKEKNPDVGIWSSYNDGGGWTAPVELANGVQEDGTRHPCWNPVLYYDDRGVLQLYYKVGPDPRTWWGMLMESMDGGRTWNEPARRLPGDVIGPVKNKPVKVGDALYCPSSTEFAGWQIHFDVTRDHGKTWTTVGPINTESEANGIQPSILKHEGDKLQILARNKQGKLLSAFSEDAGKTWSKPVETVLPNPNSGTDAVTLQDGRHLLIYNHVPPIEGRWGGKRSPLNLAISDDGLNWKAVMVLEDEPGEYSYPAIVQAPDGLVHLTWTWKRERVKHALIDPEKITGTPMPDGEWPESVK